MGSGGGKVTRKDKEIGTPGPLYWLHFLFVFIIGILHKVLFKSRDIIPFLKFTKYASNALVLSDLVSPPIISIPLCTHSKMYPLLGNDLAASHKF